MSQLLTTSQAAQRLHVDRRTVLRWCELGTAGPLPNARQAVHGGRWRIPASDVDELRIRHLTEAPTGHKDPVLAALLMLVHRLEDLAKTPHLVAANRAQVDELLIRLIPAMKAVREAAQSTSSNGPAPTSTRVGPGNLAARR
jgi:excisionase family DNA binding protein